MRSPPSATPACATCSSRDRDFRRAAIFPAGEDDIGFQARARICKFFEDRLGHRMDREDDQIADAVVQHFPAARADSSATSRASLSQLPGSPAGPGRARQARRGAGAVPPEPPADQADRAGGQEVTSTHCRTACPALQLYGAELTADAIRAVKDAHRRARLRGGSANGRSASSRRTSRQPRRGSSTQLEAERPWLDIGALDAGPRRDPRTATSRSGSGCSSGRSSKRRRPVAASGHATASAPSRPIRRTASCGPSRGRSPTPPPRRSRRRSPP